MTRFIPHHPDMVLRCVGCFGFVSSFVCMAFALAILIAETFP